jgi:hypothetical protein
MHVCHWVTNPNSEVERQRPPETVAKSTPSPRASDRVSWRPTSPFCHSDVAAEVILTTLLTRSFPKLRTFVTFVTSVLPSLSRLLKATSRSALLLTSFDLPAYYRTSESTDQP